MGYYDNELESEEDEEPHCYGDDSYYDEEDIAGCGRCSVHKGCRTVIEIKEMEAERGYRRDARTSRTSNRSVSSRTTAARNDVRDRISRRNSRTTSSSRNTLGLSKLDERTEVVVDDGKFSTSLIHNVTLESLQAAITEILRGLRDIPRRSYRKRK